MKIIKVIACSLLVLTLACNQTQKKVNNEQVAVKIEKSVSYYTVEKVLALADDLVGKTVNVSGVIDHVCKHGGKRFKMLSTDGAQELKIELGEKFAVADPSFAGSLVKVIGVLNPEIMDAEMVKAWEEKVRESHRGEENTEHFKLEISEIQSIYKQITMGEIPYYTIYAVQAEKYELE